MEAAEILGAFKKFGITAYVKGDKLVCEPGSKLPPELVPEIRQHKCEIMSLVCQERARLGDGQLPPLDRPPENETELRRLIDFLDDPVAFAHWFEALMQHIDPVEKEP
ncbi:MAG TPA: hypothetical protein VFA32_06140 [Dehalococcoidia bacterium]|jgi:hypothetical protein|nr:hypothetical protein [Dehalococcoidia bacterium]